jgi:hypothetical protein
LSLARIARRRGRDRRKLSRIFDEQTGEEHVAQLSANPMQLKTGIEKGSKLVVQHLKDMAIQVRGKEDIAHVAGISAADEEIGNLIADVMEKVGKDGVVTVEESRGLEFETEYTEGMQIDRGYSSPYFVTNTERMEAELDEPFILITDKKITAVQDLLPVLEKAMQVTKNFVIIAEDIEGEALATLVVNKLRGTVNALALKAPGATQARDDGQRGGYEVSVLDLDDGRTHDPGRRRPPQHRQRDEMRVGVQFRVQANLGRAYVVRRNVFLRSAQGHVCTVVVDLQIIRCYRVAKPGRKRLRQIEPITR